MSINASRLDRLHQPLHFRIVPDPKGVVLERVQLRKIEIYNFLFFGSGSVTGLGGLLRGLGGSTRIGADGLFYRLPLKNLLCCEMKKASPMAGSR